MRKPRRVVLLVFLLHSIGPSAFAQDAPPATPTPFTRFVRSLGRDLFGVPSKTNLLTLAIGGAGAVAVHPSDARLTRHAHASANMDEVLEFGEVAGSGWTLFGSAALTFVAGQVVDSPKMKSVGADLVRAQTLNAVLTQGIKMSVRRMRPDGSSFSFPSGHASGAFATATVLSRHFGWKVGIPAYAAATYVATSRLQENRHYASDVIFGAAIGIVAGRTVTIGHGDSRMTLSPVVGPGIAGFALTRQGR